MLWKLFGNFETCFQQLNCGVAVIVVSSVPIVISSAHLQRIKLEFNFKLTCFFSYSLNHLLGRFVFAYSAFCCPRLVWFLLFGWYDHLRQRLSCGGIAFFSEIVVFSLDDPLTSDFFLNTFSSLGISSSACEEPTRVWSIWWFKLNRRENNNEASRSSLLCNSLGRASAVFTCSMLITYWYYSLVNKNSRVCPACSHAFSLCLPVKRRHVPHCFATRDFKFLVVSKQRTRWRARARCRITSSGDETSSTPTMVRGQ